MNAFQAFAYYFLGIVTAVTFNWFAWRRYREGRADAISDSRRAK